MCFDPLIDSLVDKVNSHHHQEDIDINPFGDDNDDLEPIIQCGYGVAVGNALAHVKEAADEVAESNDDDGVARCLERLMCRAGNGKN